MAGFTPGPWFTEKSTADFWYITTSPRPFGPAVGQTWPSDDNQEANARLISAAPDMYEALEMLCAEDGNAIRGMALGIAALAKARGDA